MRTAALILRNTGMASSRDDIRILRKFSTVYSEIYIIENRGKNAYPSKMVIKLCHTKTPSEVIAEFDALSRFNAKFDDGRIGVPKPLSVDPSSKAIVMEYADGISLKKLLLHLRSTRRGMALRVVELAAIALARFHRMSTEMIDKDLSVNSPFLANNLDLTRIEPLIDSCNINLKIKSFIDFSAWNILVERRSAERITLIDFPDNDSICTPHIDLARFKYSLDIVGLHPQFRFLGLRWWNPDDLQDRFLATYTNEMGVRANDGDRMLIRWFERQYFRKLLEVYDNGNSSIKYMLEGLYMKKSITSVLKNESEEVNTDESPAGD